MIRINCPFCGLRDQTEFTYEGDASVVYPALDASEQEWYEAVYLRDNPRGVHLEYWRHAFGCGALLLVERNTLTHEIGFVRMAHPGMQRVVEESRTP